MFKNYILTALRNLSKKIGFTIVNVFGLSIGLTTCLLIYLFVNYDLSYDSFQSDNVYRIWLNRVYPEREVNYVFIPHSMGPQMVIDFPEVENQARLFFPGNTVDYRYKDKMFTEDRLMFADSTVFNVLKINVLKGNPEGALREASSIAISEDIAYKVFGDEEPIGKTLDFLQQLYTVSAVFEDYPENSHIDFNFIIPLHGLDFFNQPNWLGFSSITYLKLNEGIDPSSVEQKIPQMVKQYADGLMKARNGISYDEYIEAGNGYNYSLQHIKDIHLHSNYEGEIKANGNIKYVYIFSIVAIFILIIACINFMNLSTARSTERAKEVGIRKVLGSAKQQLVGQFLIESIVVSIFSAIIAISLVLLILPIFNDISGRPLSLLQITSPVTVLVYVFISISVGLLAGIYPAFFISSFQPLYVLKGNLKSSGKGIVLRNILVILQFAISIALISSTLLVYSQMSYLLNKPLGFEKENVVVLNSAFKLNNDPENFNWQRFETFRNSILKIEGVREIAYTSAMPGDVLPGYIIRVPGSDEKESMVTRAISFGDNMESALSMKMIKGRFFSKDFSDSLNMILNKSAVEKLGIENPIGKKIENVVDDGENIIYTIIGVIDDFHFQSLHNEMEPIVLLSMKSNQAFINKAVISLRGDDLNSTMGNIENTWLEFSPESPYDPYFLDQNLEQFYKSEQSTGRIFLIFTCLAILIACIGLLGLSAFIINQRVKEIGVRKVMGASIGSLLFLLSRDFIILIIISSVIAVPASYFWMKGWLENFAYSIDIGIGAFVIATVIATAIGLATVSIQSIKAALLNPVDSLRDE